MGGWKITQSKLRKKKKIKLAFLVIAIIIATLILGNSIIFFNSLFKPLDGSLPARQSNWDGSSNLYIILKNGENIALLTFSPGEKKVTILKIPPEVYISVPGGFGSWQVRAIFELGEKEGEDASLLKSSLSDFFGLPIDGFLDSQTTSNLETIKTLKSNPLASLTGSKRVRSDLTFFELMKLYFGLKYVRADKIEEFDLLALEVLEPSNLADGTTIYSANARLDSFLQENLADPKIKSEQLTIAVLNGTNYPGLAQKVSRMISNTGGNVIISDNTGPVSYSLVVGEDSFTKNKLKEIFHSKYAKIENQSASTPIQSGSRAQIVIYLGEDLRPKL